MITVVNGKGEPRTVEVVTVGDQKMVYVRDPTGQAGGKTVTRLIMSADSAQELAADLTGSVT